MVPLIVKLKAIMNAMRFFVLLFFQPLLFISDFLTNQELTSLKKMTLSSGNELADFVSSSFVGLKLIALGYKLN